MKKIPVLLTGFLLLTLVLHAQEGESKYFVELAAGSSFPIGKFGERSFRSPLEDDEPAGLAKPGLQLQAAIGYYIAENFGVLLSPGYSIHAQDGSGYEEYLKQNTGGMGAPPASRVEVDAERWKLLKLMAGGFLVTPLTMEEDLVLQTKITAGACKTAVPAFNFNAYSDQAGSSYAGRTDETSLNWAFCYQVSLGLKYRLNKRLHVLFDVNSFNATTSKEYTFTFPFSPNPVPARTEKVKYRLAEVNIMAGVGFAF
ncbi:hypothetical protein [Longitalea luteola]|uniref:hypothetical protein n=1 Tax=Longitalea luteola TaxID=2812563 RepID=UPI001A968438|nr:hypothetical protein [Longitalea luteola]